ncbi:MAG TPA: AAA family ATPase [Syntrophales bacterium]|nr:AAA family ATPase [Syntrophales bacterium]
MQTQRNENIIHLRDRNIDMFKKDLILRNPLRSLGGGSEEIMTAGSFGAVLAPAGVGKTAFLVQLALNAMLQEKNVLHISLDEPVTKVSIWYEKLFQDLTGRSTWTKLDGVLEDLLPHRFIMTFKVEGFSVPKLEERLTDLTAQNIFQPEMVLIDGFPFREAARERLMALKLLAGRLGVSVWFTVHTHRHEQPTADGMPPALAQAGDLFDVILQLEPKGPDIKIQPLRGIAADPAQGALLLDPATMLIRDEG